MVFEKIWFKSEWIKTEVTIPINPSAFRGNIPSFEKL